jgi:hypothetical protein
MTQKQIQKEIDELYEVNTLMISAALMVGYDVIGETRKVQENLDNRVKVNMHQEAKIGFLKSLLKENK